jgi:hypothetical protein
MDAGLSLSRERPLADGVSIGPLERRTSCHRTAEPGRFEKGDQADARR